MAEAALLPAAPPATAPQQFPPSEGAAADARPYVHPAGFDAWLEDDVLPLLAGARSPRVGRQ